MKSSIIQIRKMYPFRRFLLSFYKTDCDIGDLANDAVRANWDGDTYASLSRHIRQRGYHPRALEVAKLAHRCYLKTTKTIQRDYDKAFQREINVNNLPKMSQENN
jgi:hypothetical protein